MARAFGQALQSHINLVIERFCHRLHLGRGYCASKVDPLAELPVA